MSDYLVREIEALPNVEVRLGSEIVEARGDARLRSLVLKDRAHGTTEEVTAAAVFVLIGASPRTAWLPEAVRRDDRGYLLTGAALGPDSGGQGRELATSFPGVFAVGDVRAGSIKRVAAAVGEGSIVMRSVHEHLAAVRRAARVR